MNEDNPLVVKARRYIRSIETRDLNRETVRTVGLDAGRDRYSVAAQFLRGIEFNPEPEVTRELESVAKWEVDRENSVRRAENERRKKLNEELAAKRGKTIRQLGRERLPMLKMVDLAWYYRGKVEPIISDAAREIRKLSNELREKDKAAGNIRNGRGLNSKPKKESSATTKPTTLEIKRDEYGVRRPNVEGREFNWTPANVGSLSEGAYED